MCVCVCIYQYMYVCKNKFARGRADPDSLSLLFQQLFIVVCIQL